MTRRSGLRGVSKLRRKLRRFDDDARREAQGAVAEAADLVRFHVLRRVPVDTGDLARSIEVKLGSDKLSAEIGPGVRTRRAMRDAGWRARFIEFGTEKMAARPFLFPAFEESRREVIDIIDRGVDRAIARTIADR